jgi:hypothetical protein
MPDFDSAPLMVTPPAPPETTRSNPHLARPSNHGLNPRDRDATSRAIDLIRVLEHADGRDEVISAMVAHLAGRIAAPVSSRSERTSCRCSRSSRSRTLPGDAASRTPVDARDIVDTRLPTAARCTTTRAAPFSTACSALPGGDRAVPIRDFGAVDGEHERQVKRILARLE